MEWTADARREAELAAQRDFLLLTLKERFPSPPPAVHGATALLLAKPAPQG